jgi:hypothetical protein
VPEVSGKSENLWNHDLTALQASTFPLTPAALAGVNRILPFSCPAPSQQCRPAVRPEIMNNLSSRKSAPVAQAFATVTTATSMSSSQGKRGFRTTTKN